MANSMDDILHPGTTSAADPEFPEAPPSWSPELARQQAADDGLALTDDHWNVVRALHHYYARNEQINVRELADALNEAFHSKGGTRYLYRLLPKGPIAQGCRLAGLEAPGGAEDKGFGSVI